MFFNIFHKKDKIIQKISGILIQICLFSLILFLPLVYCSATRDNFNFPKEYLLYFFISFALAIFLISRLFLSEMDIRKTYLDIPLLCFLIFVLVSSLFSLNPKISFWGRPDVFVNYGLFFIFLSLFFWLFVQFISGIKNWQSAFLVFLFSGFIVDIIFWLTQKWDILTFNNLISQNYSALTLFNSIIIIISAGLLGTKKNLLRKIFASLCLVIAFTVLFRLGFSLGWIVTAGGLGIILFLSVVRWQKDNIFYFLFLFLIFILSFICAIVGSPNSFKIQTPPELSLSQESSWKITKNTVIGKPTNLFLGTGLGTFSYDFALYRDSNFNLNKIIENINFSFPISTALSLLTELGVIGSIILLILILLAFGSLPLLIINQIQPLIKNRKIEINLLDEKVESFRWEVVTVFSAWFCLTIAMFFIYFETVLWFVWWLMLAGTIAGFLILSVKSLGEEKKISISFKYPYTLIKSFSVLIFLTAIVSLCVYLTRFYLAETNYFKYFTASGKVEEKIVYLEKANKFRVYAPYIIDLAQNKLQQAAELSRENQTDVEKIVEFLNEAIKFGRIATDADPNNFKTWENVGNIYFNSAPLVKDADNWAKESFEKAILFSPTNPMLYLQLGNTYSILKDKILAEKNYREAIKLKPNFILAYVGLANIYEQNNLIDEAIEIYFNIPKEGRNDPDILFNYGRLLFNRNKNDDLEKAEQTWLLAVENKPNFSNVWYSLAVLYEKKGENAKAIECYEKVIELDPNNEQVKNKLKTM